MRFVTTVALFCGSLLTAMTLTAAPSSAESAARPQAVFHSVFFKLKDDSDQAKRNLVALCEKYLTGHEGTVFFSAGVLAEDLDREVNVRDFDVALHVVFKDKAAHDRYQTAERHLEFIKQGKGNWANVRVFDAYVAAPKP